MTAPLTSPETRDHTPVVIVGAGPTGLVLAHLLGVQGVRTLLIDREAGTVGEARAVTIDDESLRSIQATGHLDAVLPHITQGYGVHYYSWRQRLFARIDPTVCEYGYQRRNAFRQDVLVRQLCERLTLQPDVQVRFEHELLSLEHGEDGVVLHMNTPTGPCTWTCDWLIACDGGRSRIREQLGIALEGNTFGERWLIADLQGRASSFRHTRTYCDPVRPTIRLPGPDGTVRYEFMLHAHEQAEDVLDEARVREWIRWREPADAGIRLVRKVVYTFHARVAQRWRVGRVLLAGDAAHLTPPFAGQGMNSGVRDATNLAWKLAAVVHGRQPATLLDSYEQERKPHAWALIRMALRIGAFMQPKSRLGAAFTQGLLRLVCLLPAARDYILQLKFKPKPRFTQGFFVPTTAPQAAIPAGQLMTQPRMQARNGATVLLDDALGHGFAVLRWSDGIDLRDATWPPQVRVIDVLRREDDFLPTRSEGALLRDVSGEIARVLDSAGAQAVILRPDRYVFAYVSTGQELQHALHALSAST